MEQMVRSNPAAYPSCPPGFVSSSSQRGYPSPRAAAKTGRGNLAVVTSNAAEVAQENPAALAHLVAYFRAVQSANKLLDQYGVGAPKDQSGAVQKTAELVGLRLPAVADNKPPPAIGKHCGNLETRLHGHIVLLTAPLCGSRRATELDWSYCAWCDTQVTRSLQNLDHVISHTRLKATGPEAVPVLFSCFCIGENLQRVCNSLHSRPSCRSNFA